ncbi:MAG: nicotinamide-nucleotide amidohydrolase family protein [Planctomycetota bacterium]|nr:CinA family protein [Planctomycetaceae bacterium]MDQ3329736.1 nicotinamide-nucleotide amidohydrolase family protein [Planctomycetota bacterium]
MSEPSPNLTALAQEVADALRRSGRQLVLAESCTAGLVAASLGGVPGISQNLCGSAVVYQERTKAKWIGVKEKTLRDSGAVSEETAKEMATGVLWETPHADLSTAITGHLGPDAPADLDGVVYVAVKERGEPPTVERHVLPAPPGIAPAEIRSQRQAAAAALVLDTVLAMLAKS